MNNAKHILLLIFLLYLHPLMFAQQSGFEIYLESDYDELPFCFTLGDNSNYVGLIHKAPPPPSGPYVHNTYLYEIGNEGDTMSIKYEKEDTIFNFYDIIHLDSEPKGYLLSGWGYETGGDPLHPFTIIRRINSKYETIWEITPKFDFLYYAYYKSKTLELKNGELLYACSPQGSLDMFIYKLSSQGDSMDYKIYSGMEAGEIWDMSYSPDSSEIWLHTRFAHYPGSGAPCSTVGIDDSLNPTQVFFYPDYFDPPYSTLIYPYNRLITAGYHDYFNPHTSEKTKQIGAYLLDSTLAVLNSVYCTHPDTVSRAGEINGIDFYYPDCIYLAGTHYLQYLPGNHPNWVYIARLNDTLGIEYEKYLGGDHYYWHSTVTASEDGGVLLTGFRHEIDQTIFHRDVFFIKLDSTGYIVGNPEDLQINISEAIVYPNPGSGKINIRTAHKNCLFQLTDEAGRPVIKKAIKHLITSIPAATLSNGKYYYTLTQNNKQIASGVWIKQAN